MAGALSYLALLSFHQRLLQAANQQKRLHNEAKQPAEIIAILPSTKTIGQRRNWLEFLSS